jgi:hypothetical protein
MPMAASDSITSYGTTQNGWQTIIRKAAFDMINWDWHAANVVAPGQSAGFAFTTLAGAPTTYTYAAPGSISNWAWAYGIPGGGTVGEGNTILPVPGGVPEPGALIVLGGGLAGIGASLLRRRR